MVAHGVSHGLCKTVASSAPTGATQFSESAPLAMPSVLFVSPLRGYNRCEFMPHGLRHGLPLCRHSVAHHCTLNIETLYVETN